MIQIIYKDGAEVLLNPTHIIRAEYRPAHVVEAHIDEDSGCEVATHEIQANLIIVTSEIAIDTVSHYDGADYAAGSRSATTWLTGNVAEKVWYILNIESDAVRE